MMDGKPGGLAWPAQANPKPGQDAISVEVFANLFKAIVDEMRREGVILPAAKR